MTTAAPGRGRTAPVRRVGARQEALAGYALIAVPMLLFLVLNIGSILYAAYISVWKWNVRSGPVTFVGIDNYVNALKDPIFQSAVGNTLYYTVIWVPLTMAIGLFLAVIVNQKIRGRTFFPAPSTSRRSRPLRRSRRSGSSSSTHLACSTRCAAHSA